MQTNDIKVLLCWINKKAEDLFTSVSGRFDCLEY